MDRMDRIQETNEEHEIESYELKEEEYYGHQRPTTLLMDRFEDDPHDDPGYTEFFRNQRPSTGWVLESEERPPELRPPEKLDDEESFVTELDVNSDLIGQRKLSSNDEESVSSLPIERPPGRHRKSMSRSRSSIINDLPILYDQEESGSISSFPSYSALKGGLLSLEQLDSLKKSSGASSGAFMLDTINLSVLAKYLAKDGQQVEPDVAWTYEGLITEMADHFKKL